MLQGHGHRGKPDRAAQPIKGRRATPARPLVAPRLEPWRPLRSGRRAASPSSSRRTLRGCRARRREPPGSEPPCSLGACPAPGVLPPRPCQRVAARRCAPGGARIQNRAATPLWGAATPPPPRRGAGSAAPCVLVGVSARSWRRLCCGAAAGCCGQGAGAPWARRPGRVLRPRFRPIAPPLPPPPGLAPLLPLAAPLLLAAWVQGAAAWER